MSNDNKDKDFAPINLDASERISVSPRRPATQTIIKSNNGLVLTLALVSVVALAGCGYLYHLLQQANQTIASNNNRLNSLEERLSATGEEMDNSTATLQVRVSELIEKSDLNFSEVDKLWAARNALRKEVADLNNDIKGFKTDTTSLINQSKSQLEAASAARQQLIGRIDSLNAKLNDQANSILALKVEQEAFVESRQKSSKEIRDLSEKIILLERRNTNLVQQLNQLQQIVDELVKKSV